MYLRFLPPRPLRSHQQLLANVVSAIASGDTQARDILAVVHPGGGKSLLPVLAAARLIAAGVVERVCWVVPRDSLRLQAEEAFADPTWRDALGQALSVRAADNAPDPCRGLAGYAWSQALLPLLECAAVRLLLSGTLERADGRGILWLPYRKGPRARTREVELDAPGWAEVGYSRKQALAERAVLPVTFGALDGEASWCNETGVELGLHRLAALHPDETTRPALFTALRTGFAEALLREAFIAIRDLRARRRQERDLPPTAAARRYLEVVRGWIPAAQAGQVAQIATADTPGAHAVLAAFRLTPEPSILVTVAMAYEELDAPEVAVVAALTHIRCKRRGLTR